MESLYVRSWLNFSKTALAHAIGGILLVGYGLEYYFHLRMFTFLILYISMVQWLIKRSGHHKNHPH